MKILKASIAKLLVGRKTVPKMRNRKMAGLFIVFFSKVELVQK
jgi:hypothetical protein